MIEVLTFKEHGLLSPLAHDLSLGTDDVTVRHEDGELEVVVHVSSLRVRGKVVDGRVLPISDGDRRDIERTMREKVLRAASVRFEGALEEHAATGTLEIGRHEHELRVPFVRSGGRAVGQVELTPTRWGITPYTAMLGALRLQDRVIVKFDLPLPTE